MPEQVAAWEVRLPRPGPYFLEAEGVSRWDRRPGKSIGIAAKSSRAVASPLANGVEVTDEHSPQRGRKQLLRSFQLGHLR